MLSSLLLAQSHERFDSALDRATALDSLKRLERFRPSVSKGDLRNYRVRVVGSSVELAIVLRGAEASDLEVRFKGQVETSSEGTRLVGTIGASPWFFVIWIGAVLVGVYLGRGADASALAFFGLLATMFHVALVHLACARPRRTIRRLLELAMGSPV